MGSDTYILFWNLRRNGQSSVHGLLVAPMTYSMSSLPFVLMPSISVRNWFLERDSPPISFCLEPSSESTSSMNRITGLDSFSA